MIFACFLLFATVSRAVIFRSSVQIAQVHEILVQRARAPIARCTARSDGERESCGVSKKARTSENSRAPIHPDVSLVRYTLDSPYERGAKALPANDAFRSFSPLRFLFKPPRT